MEDRERLQFGEVERLSEYLRNEGIEMVLFDMDDTLVQTSKGFRESIWEV